MESGNKNPCIWPQTPRYELSKLASVETSGALAAPHMLPKSEGWGT